MGKTAKNAEVLSLDTSKQKEVVKETKKLKKEIKDGTVEVKDGKKLKISLEQLRGLIYIAHLPHGFYEEELKNYFKQFGKVTNVKVCRSSKTGNSKGYGYVEFSNPEVAKIAADTMNNYLMFKKRIIAEFVPYEKRPKYLFRGRPTLLTRISAKVRRQKQYQANLKVDEETNQKRTRARLLKIHKKLEKLQKMGIKTRYRPEGLEEVVKAKDVIPTKKTDKTLVSKSEKTTKVKTLKITLEQNKNTIKPKKALQKTEKVSEVDSEASSKSINKKIVKKKRKETNGVTKVTKKAKKTSPLSTSTIKKVARELIKKRGDSLLAQPKTKLKSKK